MLLVDPDAREIIQLGTDRLIIRATSDQTGGALFAAEVLMPPGGGAPVMHRHAPGEVYHVLAGEFTFYVGDSAEAGVDSVGTVHRVRAAAGDVVPLAGNTPHTIRNESDVDALAFVVHAPGPPMEGFSRAAAALAENGPPSMDRVLQVAQENGIELLGPVPPVP